MWTYIDLNAGAEQDERCRLIARPAPRSRAATRAGVGPWRSLARRPSSRFRSSRRDDARQISGHSSPSISPPTDQVETLGAS
jgi:hypothetical protein